jgi:chemosensory pili system protein ChpA (sensor histidine kinase/response regulator)
LLEVAPEPVLEPESLPEVAPEPVLEPESLLEVAPEPVLEPESLLEVAPEPELEAELEPEPEPEDQVKVIESLRIGLPLYNVYLNEADEWSRRLLTELTEWSFELDQPLPDSAVALAHSLAGSSATVGFMGLSELAHALEYALEHVQLGGSARIEHARLFIEVAEDIRRLLHQFAAGFLKQPDPAHLQALRAILDIDFEISVLPEPMTEELEAQLPEEVDVESAATVLVELPEQAELPELPEPAIEAIDALDVDLFPIFEEEALELLPQLGSALRQWSAHPHNLGARREALRVLHTLKGSARLAGAMRLGEMAHRMESAAEKIDVDTANSTLIDPLLARMDGISACFDALRTTPQAALVLPELAAASAAATDVEPAPVVEPTAGPGPEIPSVASVAPAPVVAPTPAVLARRSPGQTTRVKSKLLERMLNQAGEVMIIRARLESRLGQLRGSLGDLTGNLNRLRHQLRDMELQSESQMQSRLAQTKDTTQGFDPLEFDRFTRVQELTRMMAESVHDVATVQQSLQQTVAGVEDDLIAQGRQTRELQHELLRTRMVDFESVSDRLYGVVRQAAKDYDKPVKLDIVSGSLDMDRGVLDRVAPAFEHLLRNAVGHGIESASERAQAQKPPVGTILVSVAQQHNDFVVTISDDGAGLNLARIRDKALEKGQITPDQKLSDDEIANLIFTSGLSTVDAVSEMAGRGIGMDVVRTEVNAVGGRIELSTQAGKGTQFRLVLPLTTAVTQVVLLRMGDVVMGVPSTLVEVVRRVPVAELDVAYQSHEFDCNGEKVAFFWAGALLQISSASADVRGKTAVVAVFRSAGQRVALHVDEVLGNQEAVVKNLGPQLSRLPGLAGMSVLASGAVVLIYNPVALVTSYAAQARDFGQPGLPLSPGGIGVAGLPTAPQLLPLVLVVDDSITVRRVTQRLLKREGFRVALANDGLHALEVLQLEKPSVVLTDIEMPRMDGFDLVRNIRADAQLQDLPIIMITSRLAEKHREYARALKVDHYLGKPYPEDELISLVRGYCNPEIDAEIRTELASSP